VHSQKLLKLLASLAFLPFCTTTYLVDQHLHYPDLLGSVEWFMKRKFCVGASTLLFVSSFSAFAQCNALEPDEDSPLPDAQVLATQLIAWTEMQQPQPLQPSPSQSPTPEPRPETAPPQQPTPGQPEQKPTQPPSASRSPDQDQHVQPAAQTFTGTISKEGDSYVLKVSDSTSYKLDDQDQAKQYEGQKVRVFGTLQSGSNLIRVEKIEPLD